MCVLKNKNWNFYTGHCTSNHMIEQTWIRDACIVL